MEGSPLSLANYVVHVKGVRGQLHTDKMPTHVADGKLWFEDGSSFDLTEFPTDDPSVRPVWPGDKDFVLRNETPDHQTVFEFGI